MSEKEQVFMLDASDPDMVRATKMAQSSFKYFWRELSWEYRRIIPGLELACIKVPFYDNDASGQVAHAEEMWINDIYYDGTHIEGTLLNTPNWLTSVNAGDSVKTTLGEISDWMYAVHEKVYGGFTINVMRSRMDARERNEHDLAWGLEFGDPDIIDVVYWESPDRHIRMSDYQDLTHSHEARLKIGEHPMSLNMAESLTQQLQDNPNLALTKDENGWTMLHREALAGNLTSVRILLEHGSEVHPKTQKGETPLQLARILHWERVMNELRTRQPLE